MSSVSFSNMRPLGFGLMNFSGIPSVKFTQDEYNSALKQIIDGYGPSLASPILLNGGEFYGIPDRHEGLKLLGGFFADHPEYADKVLLSIKAGTDANWHPDTSPENLSTAIEVIDKYLQPLYEARKQLPKQLDLFTVARIGNEPVEDVVSYLGEQVDGEKISAICLSEINANTLSRGIPKSKSLAAIEIEFSLFHSDAIANGMFELCEKNNIVVVAYSPLGKGVLAGMSAKDLPEGDFRHSFDKFADGDTWKHNSQLLSFLRAISEREKLTPAQLGLSWILTVSGSVINGVKMPVVVPIPGGTNVQRQLDNSKSKKLSEEVFTEINDFLKSFKTAGHRYNKAHDQFIDK